MRKGAVLFLTLIVMSALLAISVGFLCMSSIQTKNAAIDIASSKAFWFAEAGLQRAINALKNSEIYRNEAYAIPIEEDMGDGKYLVSVSKCENIYAITSTGTADSVNRRIRQGVLIDETGLGGYPGGAPEAFYNAMHSFGTHTMFKNSTGTVNGDVTARNFVKDYDKMTIKGNVTERSGTSSPAPPNMPGYKSIADRIVGEGFVFASGNTYGAPGSEQVWYVTGNATIENDVTIYGSVIAEQNISMGVDGVTIQAASGYPAVVTGNNIHGNGLSNSAIKGLIFADNNIDFDGLDSVVINGTILSDNNTKMRDGNFIVNLNPDIINHPPPFFAGYKPGIRISLQRDWNEI